MSIATITKDWSIEIAWMTILAGLDARDLEGTCMVG